jgi:hypothetical protein
MEWLRYHDSYEEASPEKAAPDASCCQARV